MRDARRGYGGRSPHAAASLALVLALALIGAASPAAAEGTTLLRRSRAIGPQTMLLNDRHHTGISVHQGPQKGEVVWVTWLPGGLLATPAVDEAGRTYWVTQAGSLFVVDPDGAVIRQMPLGVGSHSVPALGRDGSIYAVDRDGRFVKFDARGRELWVQELKGETVSSPLLDEGGRRVIVSVEDRTVALDTDTGGVIFDHGLHNGRYNSSPTVGPDGLVRITNWQGWVMAIAPDGTATWKRRLARPGKISTPTLGMFGTLYAAADNGEVFAVSPRGLPLWISRVPGAVMSFMAMLPDGQLVVPISSRGIHTIRPDGDLGWFHRVDQGRLGFTVSVDREGTVYYATLSGTVGAVDHEGEALWSLSTGRSFGSGPVVTPPVRGVSRGVIGAQTGHIICIQ